MEASKELYHEEIKKLKDFRQRLDTHAIYKNDLDNFSNDYEDLVAQAKVITRVSDRLQKKLDTANIQIREQNDEIKDKNIQLGNTITELAEAKVGRRASTALFFLAIALFLLEELFVEDAISDYLQSIDLGNFLNSLKNYVGLFIKLILAIALKFFEGGLESFFLNQEKKKIMKQEQKNAAAASTS
jgi:predicted transcriptional regulator